MRKKSEMLFSLDIRNLMLQIYMNDMISLGDVDAILDCGGFELSGIDIQKTSVSPHIARIQGKTQSGVPMSRNGDCDS